MEKIYNWTTLRYMPVNHIISVEERAPKRLSNHQSLEVDELLNEQFYQKLQIHFPSLSNKTIIVTPICLLEGV